MDGSRFGPDDLISTELAQAPTTEAIGQVDSVKGEASIVRVDGSTVPAEAGTEIFLGDVIETGDKSAIGLVFVDDSTFSLSDSGKMTIDEMVYDPATNQGSSLFNVAEGVFTFVSGEIAKTSVDAMQIETPVATIGIRGTAGGGRIVRPADPDGQPSGTFSNFRDPITGQAGEINVFTPTGSQTLNGVNSMTSVANPFMPPSTPVKIPLSALRAVFGAAIASLPRPPARAAQQNQQGGDDDTTTGEQNGEQQQNGEDDILGEGDAAQGDEAAALAAADEAAAAAFNEALAQGLDPGAALALAGEVAAVTSARFGVDNTLIDTFSAQDAIDDMLVGITQVASGQPVSGGFGQSGNFGGGNDDFGDDDFFGSQGEEQLIGGLIDDLLAEEGFLEFFDVLPDLPPEDIPPDDGDDFIFIDEESGETTNLSATDGNDVLFGGENADEFLMYEGVSLGGDDIIDGSTGTDYITLLDLTDGWLRYDPLASAEPQIEYSFDGSSVYGTMDLTSVEEIYISPFGLSDFSSVNGTSIEINTAGDALKLSITSGDSLLGFIGIGTAADDYMDLSSGSDPVTELSMSASDVGGSVLFGLSGNDTLTGANGEDFLFGGADNDVLTGHAGNDVIYGGTGTDDIYVGTGSDYADGGDDADIFYFGYQMEGDNSQTSGTLIGGAGSDSIRLQGSNDFSAVSISGIERFAFQGSSSTATFVSSQFGTGFITELQPNSNVANHLVIDMDGSTFDASSEFSFVNSDFGNHTLTINGTTGNDTITAHTALISQTLDGGSGTDTLNLATSRDYSADTVSNIETLNFDGATSVTMIGAQLSGVTTLNFSTSYTESLTVNLSAGQNIDLSSVTVTDFTDATDTMTINGSTGAETIVGTSAADTITDGDGADTITGGSGADTITLATDSTSDTIIINSTSEFGDEISGFVEGSGGDVLDINVTLSRGTMMESLNSGATVGSSTGLVGYNGSLNGISNAIDIAGINLNGLSAGDSVLFGVSDGSDTVMWYWQDATSDGGNNDGAINTGELTKVATLFGVTDYDNLIDENLSGFDDGTTDVSGTQNYTMLASTNDVLVGSSGTDTITLVGAAENGDSVNLGAGTDTLILGTTANTLSISNTETIGLAFSAGTQTLTFGDTTSVSIANINASTVDLATVLSLSSAAGTFNQSWTITPVAATGGNFASSVIDMGDGTDTLILGSSGAHTVTSSHLGGVETLSVMGGSLNVTSTLASLSDLATISSANILNMTTIDRTSAVSINVSASDTSTYTFNASGSVTVNDTDWANISTRAFGGGLNLGTDQAFTLNIGSNFRNAFQSQFGPSKITLSVANSSAIAVDADTSFDAVRGIAFDGALGTGDHTINGTNQADTISVGTGTNTVDAEGGDDTVTTAASALTLADTINGGADTDTLSLQGGGTIIDSAFTSVSQFEEISLDDNAYNLTLGTEANGAFSSGITINSAQTTNALTLDASAYTSAVNVDLSGSSVTNDLTLGSGADTVADGSGADTITGGGGADIIQLSDDSTSDVLRYTSADFGSLDNIQGSASSGFKRSIGGDILDLDIASTVTNGTGDMFEDLTTGDTIGDDTAVINYSTAIGSYLDAATVATALNTLSGKSANDRFFFMTTDNTNSVLWYWDDTAGATNPGDGNADSDEMQQVALIAASYGDGVTSFTEDNFEGVTGGGPA